MDYSKAKQDMKKISNYAGNRLDYVQGGGGNTSVKFDDKLMAIKASGYTLAETEVDKGYVTVDYTKIKDYYDNLDISIDKDYSSESHNVNMDSIVLLDGMEEKRPSVEVGFHSFLYRCVIHTHSVYANILTCIENSESIINELFKESNYGIAYVPYVDPGFKLTICVKNAVDKFISDNGKRPDVIFMQNHGIIVSNDDADTAIKIHDNVNEFIKKELGITDYPKPLIKGEDNDFHSDTDYIKTFIKNNNLDITYFENLKLYPDQLIYIGKRLGKEVQIDNGDILYRCKEKEATTIEETLLAVVFIIQEISKIGYTLKEMDDNSVDFINNWESEKYRSQMLK